MAYVIYALTPRDHCSYSPPKSMRTFLIRANDHEQYLIVDLRLTDTYCNADAIQVPATCQLHVVHRGHMRYPMCLLKEAPVCVWVRGEGCNDGC